MDIVAFLVYIALWYFVFANGIYLLLLILAIPATLERYHELFVEKTWRLRNVPTLPGITILIPCHYSGDMLIQSIESSLKSPHPVKEVIVINDGGDDTEWLKKRYQLYPFPNIFPQQIATKYVRRLYRSKNRPKLTVIDKEHGGKGDSLNVGINHSRTPLFAAIDSDTLLEKEAMPSLLRPFFVHDDVVGLAGSIRVLNESVYHEGELLEVRVPRKYWPAVQCVEYLRCFLFGRMGWNDMGGNLIISGACGLFQRRAVVTSGGYDPENCTEDYELTLRLLKYFRSTEKKATVRFTPEPIAWSIEPTTAVHWIRQRMRWYWGLIETTFEYREMFFNPKYGATGMLGMPYLIFVKILEPFVEVATYINVAWGMMSGHFHWQLFFLFVFITIGWSILLTMIGVGIEIMTFRRYYSEKSTIRMFFLSIAENLGYRQFSAFVRVASFFRLFTTRFIW